MQFASSRCVSPYLSLSLFLALLLLMGVPLLSLSAKPLDAGSMVPKLSLIDQDGHPLDLGVASANRYTLIYFFPKAETPGCTTEACNLRDSYATLRAHGVRVIGISLDSMGDLKHFQSNHTLPFSLLSDPDRMAAESFGVAPILGGRDARESFLAHNGIIIWHDPSTNPNTASTDALAALQRLGTSPE